MFYYRRDRIYESGRKRNMKRRDFITRTGYIAILSIMGKVVFGQTDLKDNRPNILFIFSDQQHWQAMGFMDSFFDTPHLDALAKDSMVFERAFCTTPQCSPSRSSILTGFYPSTTKVMGNIGAAGGNPLSSATVGKELQDVGYSTGYFGKWHLGKKPAATAGWDDDFGVTGRDTRNDDKTTRHALDFLKTKRNKKKPFALFVSINNPHDIYYFKRHKSEHEDVPLPSSWENETFEHKPSIQKQFMVTDQGKVIHGHPRQEWEKYRDCYRAKTRLYDNHVGVILEELKRQGQWDNTIIFVASDHGDMNTQHKLIYKGPFMYEHMVRIPLMIRVPDKFSEVEPQRVKDIDVVNVDITPTIRDFCGLPGAASHGISLQPLFSKSKVYKPRDFVVSQYYGKQRWVNPIRMIRTREFKLNRHIRWGDELYDLKNDPHELKNLAKDPDYAAIKQGLAQKLDKWIKDHKDPFYSLHATSRSGKKLD